MISRKEENSNSWVCSVPIRANSIGCVVWSVTNIFEMFYNNQVLLNKIKQSKYKILSAAN